MTSQVNHLVCVLAFDCICVLFCVQYIQMPEYKCIHPYIYIHTYFLRMYVYMPLTKRAKLDICIYKYMLPFNFNKCKIYFNRRQHRVYHKL